MWGPRSIAKLVQITPITMVYGTYNYSIHGVYKPTNITGGPHIVGNRLTCRPATVDICVSSFSRWNAEKNRVFFMFHLRKAFREYHFVLRGPIQNEESRIPCRRNDHFFTTPRQKVWKCLLIQEIPCPNGLEASFLNSATSIWEVLPKWNFWWKYFASTGSFAPTSNDVRWFPHGICPEKAIGFNFFNFFWYVQA